MFGFIGSLGGAAIQAGAASSRQKKAQKAVQEVIDQLGPEFAGVKKDIEDWYSTHQYATEEDLNNYLNTLRSTSYMDQYSQFYDTNNDGVVDENDLKEFDYTGSKEDFYNKNAERILGDVIKKTQGVAASKGMGRSYDGLQAMTQAAIDKDEELWKEAFDEYSKDYDMKYRQWNDYLKQKSDMYSNYMDAFNNDLGIQKDLAGMYTDQEYNEFSDLLGLEKERMNTMAQLGAAKGSIV